MATTTRNRSNASSHRKVSSNNQYRPLLHNRLMAMAASPSNGDVLRQLYFGLLKCRMVEEYAQQRLSATEYDFAIGHEAVVVGTTFGLRAEDTITASPGNLGCPRRRWNTAATAF